MASNVGARPNGSRQKIDHAEETASENAHPWRSNSVASRRAPMRSAAPWVTQEGSVPARVRVNPRAKSQSQSHTRREYGSADRRRKLETAGSPSYPMQEDSDSQEAQGALGGWDGLQDLVRENCRTDRGQHQQTKDAHVSRPTSRSSVTTPYKLVRHDFAPFPLRLGLRAHAVPVADIPTQIPAKKRPARSTTAATSSEEALGRPTDYQEDRENDVESVDEEATIAGVRIVVSRQKHSMDGRRTRSRPMTAGGHRRTLTRDSGSGLRPQTTSSQHLRLRDDDDHGQDSHASTASRVSSFGGLRHNGAKRLHVQSAPQISTMFLHNQDTQGSSKQLPAGAQRLLIEKYLQLTEPQQRPPKRQDHLKSHPNLLGSRDSEERMFCQPSDLSRPQTAQAFTDSNMESRTAVVRQDAVQRQRCTSARLSRIHANQSRMQKREDNKTDSWQKHQLVVNARNQRKIAWLTRVHQPDHNVGHQINPDLSRLRPSERRKLHIMENLGKDAAASYRANEEDD